MKITWKRLILLLRFALAFWRRLGFFGERRRRGDGIEDHCA